MKPDWGVPAKMGRFQKHPHRGEENRTEGRGETHRKVMRNTCRVSRNQQWGGENSTRGQKKATEKWGGKQKEVRRNTQRGGKENPQYGLVILSNSYASCSFGLAKDCFRKGIFLYFVTFLSFFSSCVRKLENGFAEGWKVFLETCHIGYQKSRNLCWYQKQTYNSDNMPPLPKKLKWKKMGLSKIRKRFVNFNFFLGGGVGILSLRQVCWNQHKITDLLNTIWPISRKKNSTSQEGHF